MKKLFLGSVALVAMLGGPAAFAADMPARPLPPPVPVANWTGCYVGGFIGTNYGNAKVDRYANTAGQFAGEEAKYDMSGMLGGAAIGCNYQVGLWVWGIEGDWAVTNKDGQQFDAISRTPAPINGLLVDQTHERWLATARLRLGYAVTDKWLWYVTGGGAWISAQQSKWVQLNPAIAAVQSQNFSGWTVGLGTEYMLGYGWSIKSEFLYVDVGSKSFFNSVNLGGVTFPGEDVKIRDYAFKFGMNYSFGWVGKGKGVAPVVAPISK
jgi:outer membrane immunogenic protein